MFDPAISRALFAPFVATVMISAWFGLGPGLLATLLSSLASVYFFLPPIYSFRVAAVEDFLALSIFVTVAIGVSSLVAARRRAETALRGAYDELEARVEERTRDLAAAKATLENEGTRRKRLQEQFESLALLAQAITSSLELSEVLDRVVHAATDLLPDSVARIWVIEGDRLVLRSEAGTHGPPRAGRKTEFALGEGLIGQAAFTRGPLAVEDVLSDSRIVNVEWMRQEGFQSLVSVPLLVRDRLVGVLSLLTRDRHSFRTEEIELLTSFGTQAAIAIENAQLYAGAEGRRREAEVLAELVRNVNASLNIDTVLQRVAEGAKELCGSDMAQIALRESASDAMVVRYLAGTRYERYGDIRVEAGKGLGGQVLLTGRPIRTDHYAEDPRLTKDYLRMVSEEGIVAEMVVPIATEGRVEGLLYVSNRSPRPFADRDEAVLLRLAEPAAIAIQNARLFEETERRRQAAESLAEVGRVLAQSLDLDPVGQRIADSVRGLLGVQVSVLYRLEPHSGDLVSVAVSGDIGPAFPPRRVLPRGTGAAGLAVLERRLVVTPNLLTDPRITLTPELKAAVEQEAFRGAMAVPLVVKDRVIGALGVGDREGRVFDAEELRLAQAFADQAATVLENARLFGDLRVALAAVEASQQQLVQTERLRALGEMAAGVAHDFNNLLAVILGRAELLLARVSDPEQVRGLETVRKAALDGAQTVRRIQEFTRTRRTRPFGQVDLRELLFEVVELTRPRWKDEAQSRGITYEVRVGGGPVPLVAGIAEELREVFANLLINALEAMPAGGRLIFRLATEADGVVVTAKDTGGGMSEETRRRVFDPFFTTKGPRGTGLGLAVAWGIITRHGGAIDVESTLGVETTFTVRLPIHQKAPSEEESESLAGPARAARVLLIEDEPEVRAILSEVLTEHGYKVVEASDGQEGLARCEAEPIDLIVSDLSMPRMSGWEVAAACQARFPHVPVGFITGWGDQLDPDQLRRHRIRFVLAKPCAPGDMLQQVAKALKTDHTP
jgi:GAF domain-containing protein/ActR/RegA family two-component response regulator